MQATVTGSGQPERKRNSQGGCCEAHRILRKARRPAQKPKRGKGGWALPKSTRENPLTQTPPLAAPEHWTFLQPPQQPPPQGPSFPCCSQLSPQPSETRKLLRQIGSLPCLSTQWAHLSAHTPSCPGESDPAPLTRERCAGRSHSAFLLFWPQGLCTCCSFCLECSAFSVPMAGSSVPSRAQRKCHPLRGAVSDPQWLPLPPSGLLTSAKHELGLLPGLLRMRNKRRPGTRSRLPGSSGRGELSRGRCAKTSRKVCRTWP